MELNKLKQLLDQLSSSELDKQALLGIIDLKVEDEMRNVISEIKGEFKEVKGEFKEVRGEFKAVKAEINSLKWFVGIFLTVIIVLLGIIKFS